MIDTAGVPHSCRERDWMEKAGRFEVMGEIGDSSSRNLLSGVSPVSTDHLRH